MSRSSSRSALAAALGPFALSSLVRIAGVLVLLSLPALPVTCGHPAALDAVTQADHDSSSASGR